MAGSDQRGRISNGLDSEAWTSYPRTVSQPPLRGGSKPPGPPPSPDVEGFVHSILTPPMSLLRPGSGPHPIVPRDLLTSTQNQGANFLTFPPDVVSGEDHLVYYFAVVKSFGPEEKTVVVKTLKGCEVTCHTEGCQGQERLCEGGLVQICHHKSGDKEGKTFVSNASGELTPTTSHAGSKVGSRAGSRAPSRQPSRPPSPVEG